MTSLIVSFLGVFYGMCLKIKNLKKSYKCGEDLKLVDDFKLDDIVGLIERISYV